MPRTQRCSDSVAEGYGVFRNGRLVFSMMAADVFQGSMIGAHQSCTEYRKEFGGEIHPVRKRRSGELP